MNNSLTNIRWSPSLPVFYTICISIKVPEENRPAVSGSSPGEYDIKAEFERLDDADRLIASLYIGGKFLPDEISAYTGISPATVKKSLDRVLSGFELD